MAETVTLVRLDGSHRSAVIEAHSANRRELALIGAPAVPVDTLAYVMFLQFDAGNDVSTDILQLPRRRVHFHNGASLVVRVRPLDLTGSGLGFYVWPAEPMPEVRAVYLYRHAIRLLEDPTLTGGLLVAAGLVAEAEVAAAHASQQARLGDYLVGRDYLDQALVDEAASVQNRKRMRLGEVLLAAALITPEQLAEALAEQAKRRGKRLGEILIERGAIDEVALTDVLARKFGMPVVDLDQCRIDPAAVCLLPSDIVRRYSVLPIGVEGDRITLVIPDPLVHELHDVIRFSLPKKRVVEVLAVPSQLRRHIALALGDTAAAEPPEVAIGKIVNEMAPPEPAPVEADAAPSAESDSALVRLVNQVIADGIRAGASDIHVEPDTDRGVLVRFRVDGDCRIYTTLPAAVRHPFTARVKIMADLDISERRRPQDGKMRFKHDDRIVELRVASFPTIRGNEDLVLRVLASATPLPIDEISLSARNLASLRSLIIQPYGLILCVGPTGSGKTTTLHSVLSALNQPDTKVVTAEDPVEITQAGLRQVQINPKAGLDFAAALRSFLRADPDVIMVGEMRDKETASIAVEAALTGHLVLSTLHTNGAPEAAARLLDMGIDPFNFSDALLGVLAQRLARRLCTGCRVRGPLNEATWAELALRYGAEAFTARYGPWKPSNLGWSAPGCKKCAGTGFRGRVALHELMAVDDNLRGLIRAHKPMAELRVAAAELGMTSLAQDGIEKVLDGHTTLAQVLAVCTR